MIFPLSFWDLSLWIAIIAIILLITSELLSPNYGRTSIIINRKRLRTVALSLGILFMLTVFIRVYEILSSH
jgi:hypothetical protein